MMKKMCHSHFTKKKYIVSSFYKVLGLLGLCMSSTSILYMYVKIHNQNVSFSVSLPSVIINEETDTPETNLENMSPLNIASQPVATSFGIFDE